MAGPIRLGIALVAVSPTSPWTWVASPWYAQWFNDPVSKLIWPPMERAEEQRRVHRLARLNQSAGGRIRTVTSK